MLSQRKKKLILLGIFILSTVSLFPGCASRPTKLDNICHIFSEKPDWFDDTNQVFEKWGVPIHVQMAILRQESSFESDAKPPRKKLFGFIPTFRPSSAYGYAQVLDGTWDWYVKKTGNTNADRDDFSDAVDFVGWYVNESYQRLKISKWDAKKQYLAYHEGQGGYERKTYNKKKWLMGVAEKVNSNAKSYRKQLPSCQEELENRWHFWPFG